MRKPFFIAAALTVMAVSPLAISQGLFASPGALGQTSALTIDQSRGVLTMAPLLERVTPAVVSIEVSSAAKTSLSDTNREMLERFFGRSLPDTENAPQRRRQGIGSGVIVDAAKGYIMTNHHVIDGAEDIYIRLEDRSELEATLVGSDSKTDIAILQVKASGLTALPIARSGDVRVGDYVIAVGNPFGLSHSVTSGIVSALGRDNARGGNYADFIQTDASINPGNSGGALVNSKGELIGINTAIVTRSGGNNGIGFAVPTKIADAVMKQLVRYGEVKRGRIGVAIQNIPQDLKEALNLSTNKGALVSEVVDDSPADKAGIKTGDIITNFNGETILDSSDIRNAVSLVEPGRRTDITYLRDGKKRTTRILVEEFEEDREVLSEETVDDIPAMESFSGAELTNIPDDVNPRGGNAGVYVAKVASGSKAQRAGLVKGDIIRKINRSDVADLKAFERFIDGKDGPFALSIERGGSNIFVAVR